ncbi:hypothetical protein [Oceanicoccus sagamiensis]|uniref:Uncharacterized protein n=1 Tax=Oceanicoccus sagamiensis TaxID=716816 RepID=A0A1X9N5P8_9GAMM|nr:hypothetical protein [Oceanicoccus sagamiensis]ARN73056.1 hypothetical protein BST96_02385 [Oceanicoccus sagamiensis]
MIKKLLSKLEQTLKDGDVNEAKKIIAKIHKRPQMPEVYLDIALYCINAKLWDVAKYNFEKATQEKPELCLQLTLWLDKEPLSDTHHKALELLNIAKSYLPDNQHLTLAEAAISNRMDRFEHSMPLYEAILADPQSIYHFNALLGLNEAYFKTNRYHDAVGAGLMALQLQPDNITANFQLGLTYMAIENDAECVEYLAKVINANPDHLGAHINLAHIMLKLGLFDEGWQHHEWRFHESMKNIANFNLPMPRWYNEDIKGKHLFVWVDQGLGDQVMYCSLIGRLIDSGVRVTIMAERRLRKVFMDSFDIEDFFAFDREGIKEMTASDALYHYHTPMGTLPAFFIHSFDDFKQGEAYLKTDQAMGEQFRTELQQLFPGKTLVGFGWRGGIAATRNHARRIDIELLSPLFEKQGFQFINFQYDATDEEKAQLAERGVYTPDINLRIDINTVLAYMSALDLYITADNTNAHFAGAIGLPVWNLIPVAAEWRWFTDEKKSYWYKSMVLYRQKEIDRWDDVVADVGTDLEHFVTE